MGFPARLQYANGASINWVIAMHQLTSIVALNTECAIGVGNALPWRIRSDMRFFREQTLNNVVIMGRRTFDSLGRRGLPDRKNIVVTHGFGMFPPSPGCYAVGSISEALLAADDLKTKKQEVFVVGGASMYEQFSPFVDRYLITEIAKDVPHADTFFDRDLITDADEWAVKVLREGKADGAHDEADFVISEYKNVRPGLALARRDAAVASLKARRSGNSLAADFRAARAFG